LGAQLVLQQGCELEVEVGGRTDFESSLRCFGGEFDSACEQGAGSEDVIELTKGGRICDSFLHARDAFIRRSKMDIAGAELGFAERRGLAHVCDLLVGGAGLGIAPGVKVGVAEGLVKERVAQAECGGALEARDGFGKSIEPDQTCAGVEPGNRRLRADLAGTLEVRESRSGAAGVLEFGKAQFNQSLGVVGIGDELLLAKDLIELVLLFANVFGVFDVAEVVNYEVSSSGRQVKCVQPPGDGFVDAALVVNAGVAAKEAGGGQWNVSGVGAGFLDQNGIGAGGLKA